MGSYLLSIVLSVCVLTTGQVITNTGILTMIDFSFFWGLIGLVIGTCFYVLQTGFLDLFFDGFRRVAAITVPKSRSLERVDKRMKEDESLRLWKQGLFAKSKQFFFGIGSGMTLFSFILLLFI